MNSVDQKHTKNLSLSNFLKKKKLIVWMKRIPNNSLPNKIWDYFEIRSEIDYRNIYFWKTDGLKRMFGLCHRGFLSPGHFVSRILALQMRPRFVQDLDSTSTPSLEDPRLIWFVVLTQYRLQLLFGGPKQLLVPKPRILSIPMIRPREKRSSCPNR